jgi:hypothetical protein
MKFTNVYGLPAALFEALSADDYELAGDISVTGLIKPPRMAQLEKRFDKLITDDVSERVWLLLGKSVHVVLEHASRRPTIAERTIQGKVLGWTVSGTIDMWDNGVLYDYKVTSVWSVIFGLKPEWEAQVNAYAYLLPKVTEKLKVGCILRDWSKRKAQESSDYPQIPVAIVDVPMWDDDKALSWLEDRVRLHQDACNLDDYSLPFCTPDERWAKPTTWAVMKKGRKSALRVLPTKAEAEAWLAEKGGDSIVERPGESVRCESYCLVKKFCNQYMEGHMEGHNGKQ